MALRFVVAQGPIHKNAVKTRIRNNGCMAVIVGARLHQLYLPLLEFAHQIMQGTAARAIQISQLIFNHQHMAFKGFVGATDHSQTPFIPTALR